MAIGRLASFSNAVDYPFRSFHFGTINTMSNSPVIPVILGPTATGKTAVGIHLAREMNGEIISVDSRKVYKYLSIGTATPPGEWTDGIYWVKDVPHHLMAHLPPDQAYNAGDFAKDAEQLIGEVLKRGRLPILVGGTGFYFKALVMGLPELPPKNDAIRNELAARLEKEGHGSLFAELKAIDPESGFAISPQDSHKLIRALEVHRLTGQPFSSWKNAVKKPSRYKFTVLGLHANKAALDKKIEERSRRMFEEGMIEETEALIKKGFSKDCPALSSFGYREAVQVLEGQLPRSNFLSALIKGTKAYAKRQNTWFRTQTKPVWFDCQQNNEACQLSLKMRDFLNNPPKDFIYSTHV